MLTQHALPSRVERKTQPHNPVWLDMLWKRSAIFLAIFACAVAVTAQEPAKQTRVHVNLRDGTGSLEGTFISGTAESVTIRRGSIDSTIKLDAIASIFFLDSASSSTSIPSPQDEAKNKVEAEAAQRAIRALRKLATATQVGVSYRDYTPMVVDAKSEVDGALGDMPGSELKLAIVRSMNEYELAARVWQYTWRDPNITDSKLKDIATKEYGLKKHGLLKVVWRDDFLSAIWARARENFEQADALSK